MACYVGAFGKEYEHVATRDLKDKPQYSVIGNGQSMLSNRVSWFYNLKGPSATLDTACSSSLVALHLACETIRSSRSNTRTALAAGCGLILGPETMTSLSALHFLSPDSRSYSFDDRANGYARGEGFGAVLLKHMDDAIRDGDTIRAVIRGTGVNQDGKTSGITLPSSDAQVKLIRDTYASCGLELGRTAYFEAHGTGTAAGDPLEAHAIGNTFGAFPGRESPIYIGSVKSNIGHLEGCAGIAGVVKSVLSLESGYIFPQHDFRNPNPKIDLENWKLAIPSALIPWPRPDIRRISINSFGYGGTNAHVILDDALNYLRERGLAGIHNTNNQPRSISESSSFQDSAIVSSYEAGWDGRPEYFSDICTHQPKIFTIMSSEQAAIPRLASNLAAYIGQKIADGEVDADQCLDDLAYTLNARRSTFQWRSFVTASTASELQQALEAITKPLSKSSKIPKMLWVFTGQGAQWAGMGAELLKNEVFAKVVTAADECLKTLGAQWSVKTELLQPSESSRINEPQYSQPLCTIVQVGIIELLRHWAIEPSVVVGHSSGEIAAAYAIGALSAADAYKVAYHRGRLSQKATGMVAGRSGAMLSVGLSRQDVAPYLSAIPKHCVAVVACENSPSNVTISGDKEALDGLKQRLEADEVFARMLKVTNAYHSPYMEIIAEEYLESLQGIAPINNQGNIKMFSTVTATLVDPTQLGPKYWVQNMTQTVQFVGALEEIFTSALRKQRRRRNQNEEVDTILEVGPHGALQGPLKQFLVKHSLADRVTMSSILSRGQNALTTALDAAGKLWSLGCPVDLSTVNRFDINSRAPRLLVDLPSYSWNHSGRYWSESSQSRSHRFPLCGRLDYTGMPVEDFNPAEPLFKNNLRASELPWLLDHKVQHDVIFPGAGMICAAIEASKQLQDSGKKLLGFELRDVCIGQALIMPSDDSGIETYLQLKPRKLGMRSTASSWQEWTFYTLSKQGVPTEHASGLISLTYSLPWSEVHSVKEDDADLQKQRQAHETALEQCTRTMSKTSHYDSMLKAGLNYGPTFQGLGQIRIGPSTACSTITIPDTLAVMPSEVETESTIHPATLDALLQSCFPAWAADDSDAREAMVPTIIGRIFVPADMPRSAGDSFEAVTTTRQRGYRDLIAHIIGANSAWSRPSLTINGLVLTAVGSTDDEGPDSEFHSTMRAKICSEVVLRPDVNLLSQQNARVILAQAVEPLETLRRWQHDSSKAAAIWTQRTLRTVSSTTIASTVPHFRHYFQWLQDNLAIVKARKHPHQHGFEEWLSMCQEDEDAFLINFAAQNPNDGLLMNCVAKELPALMLGETHALAIMTQNDMLSKAYKDAHGLSSCANICRDWIDLAGHKNPDMKILEIGAGTGSVTFPALKALGGSNGSTARFQSYTFTDISSGFFEKAQELLAEWGNLVEFRKLDIEKDPQEQGFELQSFDVLVTSNVLHATRDIKNTLSNCIRLLKPGGRLILGEITYPADYFMIVYGTLPGWWLSEDGRVGGPLMSESKWDTKLREVGFSGVDYAVRDAEEDELARAMSVLVSTKPLETALIQSNIMIVVQPDSSVQQAAASVLCDLLLAAGIQSTTVHLHEAISQATDYPVISLCEVDSMLLYDVSSSAFEDVKAITTAASWMLWVTASPIPHDPNQRVVSGLLRCAAAEAGNAHHHELHLSGSVQGRVDQAMALVCQAFTNNPPRETSEQDEHEMIESEGLVAIPRYVDLKAANDRLEKLGKKPKPELQPLIQAGRPLTLTVGSPGMLDSLYYVDDDSSNGPLPSDFVEIEVKANGLNFVDVMMAMGKVPERYLGTDSAGIVSCVGTAVTTLKCGDRVALLKPATFTNIVRSHHSFPQVIPDDMSMEEACSLPAIFSTAYQSLVEVARLQAGENILIHAAAGGLGQALIQLAQYIGAEIYATVGTAAKKELLLSLGVEADHIFSSRDISFANGIMRMTNGRGVDVAVNSLAGEMLAKTWDCVAEFGRFIEVGKVDIFGNTGLEMMPFLENRMFAAVNIEHLGRRRPVAMAKVLKDVFSLVHKGIFRPVRPITVFDYSDMEAAFRTMQQGRHTGKIVLKATPQSLVPVIPRDTNPLVLSPNATYILAGGLGGLGRSQATYMAKHGARHLVFLSRSGAAKTEAQETLKELRAMGVKIRAISCDVADASQLQQAISSLSGDFPPIKGVVQGAMVLKDGLWESMTHERWLAATRPKIQGTWNLHNILPKHLDFFIMLSSASGINASRGQSNYAAGNTFQDAFATYRRSLGLKAQTLDLGAITGIGFFEENGKQDASNALNFVKAIHVKAECFLSMFGSAMTGRIDGDDKLPAQVIMGVGSGGLNRLNTADGKGHEFYWLDKFSSFRYLKKLDTRGASGTGSSTDDGGAESFRTQLTSATSMQQAVDLCQDALVAKLAKAIMINPADIDTTKPLHSYGVDSLVAVEVRNYIMRELKSEVSVFEILANNPLAELAVSVAGKCRLLPKELTEDIENA